jgi:hypothetical protein
MSASDVAPVPRTDWTLALVPALIPLLVAASLVFVAFRVPPVDGETLSRNLVTIVVLQLVGALALRVLAAAYADSASRAAALRYFFIGYAVIIVVITFSALIPRSNDWRPRLDSVDWPMYAINLGVMAIDTAVAIACFRGDPRREGARLQAAAADLFDLWALALQAMFVVFAIFLLCIGLNPDAHPQATRAVFLDMAAAYFVAKAVIVVYVRSAPFAASGKRLLAGVDILPLRQRDRDAARVSRRDEDCKAAERRAIFNADGPRPGEASRES